MPCCSRSFSVLRPTGLRKSRLLIWIQVAGVWNGISFSKTFQIADDTTGGFPDASGSPSKVAAALDRLAVMMAYAITASAMQRAMLLAGTVIISGRTAPAFVQLPDLFLISLFSSCVNRLLGRGCCFIIFRGRIGLHRKLPPFRELCAFSSFGSDSLSEGGT